MRFALRVCKLDLKRAAAQQLPEEHSKAVRVRVRAVAQEVGARRVRVEARRAGDRRGGLQRALEVVDAVARATKWAGASFADKFEEVDLKDGEC